MEQQNIRQIAFDFYTELCRIDEEFANYFTPKIEDYQNWRFVVLERERGRWDYTFCYNTNKNFVKLNLNMGHSYNPQKLKEIEQSYSFDPNVHGDNKKINFAGDSFSHVNGRVDCENLSQEDFLLWLEEASNQMLDFRENQHDKVII